MHAGLDLFFICFFPFMNFLFTKTIVKKNGSSIPRFIHLELSNRKAAPISVNTEKYIPFSLMICEPFSRI